MNLYDKDDGFRCFTLNEANSLIPIISAATEDTVIALEEVQDQLEDEQVIDIENAQNQFEQETALILQRWSQQMVELGVYPKGYFTVDFKSPIPDTLFCWTFGETEISHTHKIYENFKNRMPIQNEEMLGFEESLN
ncbi:MAG: DUF2203 family protein [bacterium]